jgi:Transposase IS116/IS110/IS902 family
LELVGQGQGGEAVSVQGARPGRQQVSLDQHGTTLCDEPGIEPTSAATLLVEVGDPFRFAGESKSACWCGTGAVALSSREGAGLPAKHRLNHRGNRRIRSVLFVSVWSNNATARHYIDRKLQEGKTIKEARCGQATRPKPSRAANVERRITTSNRTLDTGRLTRDGLTLLRPTIVESSVVENGCLDMAPSEAHKTKFGP